MSDKGRVARTIKMEPTVNRKEQIPGVSSQSIVLIFISLKVAISLTFSFTIIYTFSYTIQALHLLDQQTHPRVSETIK